MHLKDTPGRPASVAPELQQVFEKLCASVHKDPAFFITGKIETALYEGLKIRNPSNGVAAYLEPNAANIEGQPVMTALAVGYL
eukprot:10227677-Karenia_brevis.AAC.1